MPGELKTFKRQDINHYGHRYECAYTGYLRQGLGFVRVLPTRFYLFPPPFEIMRVVVSDRNKVLIQQQLIDKHLDLILTHASHIHFLFCVFVGHFKR